MYFSAEIPKSALCVFVCSDTYMQIQIAYYIFPPCVRKFYFNTLLERKAF